MAQRWALILGASSGFGAAAARAFAAAGYGIAGVHLDRRSTMGRVEELCGELAQYNVPVRFFNENAADDARREGILDALATHAGPGEIGVLLHSLAFGTLRPFIAEPGGSRAVSRRQLDMTVDVMAHSLVYWAQDLVSRGLMAEGGRVLAMTSEGSRAAMPAYGPVSAAKAALEAHCRQLALELAPHKITVNAVMAGVTDTPALRKIPGHERLIEEATRRNPHGRLTTPEDVAPALVALAGPGMHWVTGNTLRIDGGEGACG